MSTQGIARAELDLDRQPFVRCTRCNGWNQDFPAYTLCRTCQQPTYSEPYQTLDGGWIVRETSHDGISVGIHILNRHDQTAAEPIAYDAKCSWCWLGYAHSGDMHRARLAGQK